MKLALVLSAIAMVLRVRMASSSMSERKLRTGRPSSVRLAAAFLRAALERLAGATIEARSARPAGLSWGCRTVPAIRETGLAFTLGRLNQAERKALEAIIAN